MTRAKTKDKIVELPQEDELPRFEARFDYNDLYANLKREIRPQGAIEIIYFEDLTHLVWEILRLRRSKAAIIKLKLRDAFIRVINQVYEFDDVEGLANDWFVDADVKKQVSEILEKYQLDEFVVEAEAIKSSLDELEKIEKLMIVYESRRDKALRFIGEYRCTFAEQLRQSSQRMIEVHAR